ncbi:hypothetical protein AVEN_184312-1 [Araneus ventricosus]|uniref:Uncharacterized protein n=1 Tax=Araneus ventricosus TaxID=182803 RepID=A0A4Y2K1D6_ARAVE|nr:hypothetical protein AVEN_184312-1 [Araneus ventricosus]
MKEEYNTIASVLKKIKYQEHQWVICVDLKVVNFLLGQQSGHIKYPCFLCLWNSREKHNTELGKKWRKRENMDFGEKNVINNPLVGREKIIFPPLHIKLVLTKQFDKDGSCFACIGKNCLS